MNIGILAYNSACNFGANLQLLSTVEYLHNLGHNPFVINWCPISLEKIYNNSTPLQQQLVHKEFRNKYYNETKLCRDAKEVANVINDYNIKGVIIGSDAVSQHHPLMSRILFPSKTIISINPISEERVFPNVFWGEFHSLLPNKIPMVLLSTSCQNSAFKMFGNNLKKQMYNYIEKFKYISVRDKWTQDMFSYISNGKIIPEITPDPVFAFNNNVRFVPRKEDVLKKFSLPEKYILFGLHNKRKISDKWLAEFENIASSNGYACTNLPFPAQDRLLHKFKYQIHLPLDPLDWYALIRYSSGYVGHNMHPIVVALHNCVPFFSIDHYGVTRFRFFLQKESSKIYDILNRADFTKNRVPDGFISISMPKPSDVYNRITQFDYVKCEKFKDMYFEKYSEMMRVIIKSLML